MAGDAGLKEAVTQVAAGVLVALHCLYIKRGQMPWMKTEING
jgi:hypothetical protein